MPNFLKEIDLIVFHKVVATVKKFQIGMPNIILGLRRIECR